MVQDPKHTPVKITLEPLTEQSLPCRGHGHF